jgi:hypothetical protein
MGVLVFYLVYLVAGAVLLAVCTVIAVVSGGVKAVRSALVVFIVAITSVRLNPYSPVEAIGIQPSRPGEPGEPAYRQYFFGPVFRDFGLMFRDIAVLSWAWLVGNVAIPDRYHSPAERPTKRWPAVFTPPPQSLLMRSLGWMNKARDDRRWPLLILLLVAEVVGLVVGAGVATAALLAVTAIFTVALIVVAGLGLTLAVTLHGIESMALWVRGITLECSSCHERVTHPVYQCGTPVCQALHRRLLPSRLGVFTHICRCGHSLPTLLALGKGRLLARCDTCNDILPTGGLSARTAHVTVVAGPSAGKTAFILAALSRLEAHGEHRPDEAIHFADTGSGKEFARARKDLLSGDLSRIRATRPAAAIRAWTFYVGKRGVLQRLVYLYDPAGEHLWGVEDLAHWGFLSHTVGMVFIVDPFSFPELSHLLDDEQAEKVRPCRVPPTDVLSRITEALRERTVGPPSSIRPVQVAVVLTKGDILLQMEETGHPYDGIVDFEDERQRRKSRDSSVREWLKLAASQRNLVVSIDHTFPRVSYFVTSALDSPRLRARLSARSGEEVINDDPADALLWLLRQE